MDTEVCSICGEDIDLDKDDYTETFDGFAHLDCYEEHDYDEDDLDDEEAENEDDY